MQLPSFVSLLSVDLPVPVVPDPGILALLAIGLVSVVMIRRRQG
jgi:hypothetical protein